MSSVAPEVTETGTFVGQSIPRKEDGRLVQGQGVFVDDIKRHNMGYVHFVRSPYAHARILSVDVSAALEAPGVLGTLTGDEVAILTEPFFQIAPPPGGQHQGLRPRRRPRALRRRSRRRGRRVDARARARRGRADRGRVRAAARPVVDARTALDPRSPVIHEEIGSNESWQRHLRVGRRRRRIRRGRPRRLDRRAALRPLQLDAARAGRRARRVQPRHRAVDDLLQQPVPGLRGDHDGPRDRRRPRQAAHGHAGHRRRLRQQDHVAPAARRLLPAGAQARPARAVDGDAHRLPPVDVARQRALVPGRRGRGQGRRHDARLPLQGARRRRRLPALRAARRRDLGAGQPRHVPLAQHPRRVLAGHHQQGAGLAQPRLLAHAAPVADRAHHRHRRARARLRSDRAAQAQLRPARADAVHDAERLRLRLGRLPARARHARSS